MGLLRQRFQALQCGGRLMPRSIQRRLLQADMLRQVRMKLRRGGGLFTVVGLTQTGQPGVSQVGTALGEPQFAFDQSDHRQVVDRRHVPDMHQALGLGQFSESFGEVTAPTFEAGDHTMPDQHTDVAAGARFRQAGPQTCEAGFGLATHQQQETLIKAQARTHGVQPLWCQAL